MPNYFAIIRLSLSPHRYHDCNGSVFDITQNVLLQRFPDVTICNVHPFGHSDENSLTWSAYMEAMTAKKQQWPYERLKSIVPDLAVGEYNAIWADLSSHLGYTTNLIPNVKSQLRASQSQQLIARCLLFDKEWFEAKVECKSILHFHWDQSYQKCYTIRIPRNTTEVRLFGYNRICICVF